MKRHLSFLVFLFVSSTLFCQYATWSTANGDPCAPPMGGTNGDTGFSDPCITAVEDLCRGAGLLFQTGGDFNSRNFDTSNTSCADAQADGDCVTWGFTVTSCLLENPTLEFELDVSGSGPTDYCLDMDVNGTVTNISTGPTDDGSECLTIDLGDISAAKGTDTVVEFNLCAWGASSSSGTMDIEEGSECSNAGIALSGSTVPVDLISFESRNINDAIELDWATASEINAELFEVQRSENGSDFEAIGLVDANGNSTQRIDYYFVDENPGQGSNCYRLKQVDFNGTSSLSNVVCERMDDYIEVTLTPSPVSTELFISSNEVERLDVYSVSGEKVISIDDFNAQYIDMSHLNAGIYLVQMEIANQVITKRIIKQ